MRPDYIFWAALACYAVHLLEEYCYDWKTWAQKILKLDVNWNTFYVTNVATCYFLAWLAPKLAGRIPLSASSFPRGWW